ncbi:MAG: lysophospholipid acyltransferase family protein [Gemmatimonadaceae bacterium]
MGDLHLSADSTELFMPRAGIDSRVTQLGRSLRSGLLFLVYWLYLGCFVGLGQRLVIWPAILLVPRRRNAIVRAWLKLNARISLGLARYIANVRVTTQGPSPAESCIVVMNHQSLLDIPIAIDAVFGPPLIILTRDRYQWGIPGISVLGRLARFPFVSQKRTPSRLELAMLTGTVERVDRGEESLLIFPEGHRSRDGSIGRFMRGGLRIVLAGTRRPVYCIVTDGMAHARTFRESLVRFASSDVRAVISGPFTLADHSDPDAFIASLREHMIASLEQLRSTSSDHTPSGAADTTAAR